MGRILTENNDFLITEDGDHIIQDLVYDEIIQDVSFYENMPALYNIIKKCLNTLTDIYQQLQTRIDGIESAIPLAEIPPSRISYLGNLASDPNTSGWGEDEAFKIWFNTSDKIAKYWSGSEILLF